MILRPNCLNDRAHAEVLKPLNSPKSGVQTPQCGMIPLESKPACALDDALQDSLSLCLIWIISTLYPLDIDSFYFPCPTGQTVLLSAASEIQVSNYTGERK